MITISPATTTDNSGFSGYFEGVWGVLFVIPISFNQLGFYMLVGRFLQVGE